MRCFPLALPAIATLALLVLPVATVQAEPRVPISQIAPDSGLTGDVLFLGLAASPDGPILHLAIEVPELTAALDAAGFALGNLGSSRHRLYWVGPTDFSDAGAGGMVTASSHARWEEWADLDPFGDHLTRLLRDTKKLNLAIRPIWDTATGTLSVEVVLLNIDNVPGEVEQWLQRLGVDFTRRARLFDLPDSITAQYAPVLVVQAATLLHGGRGVRYDLRLALHGDAVPQTLPGLMLAFWGLSG